MRNLGIRIERLDGSHVTSADKVAIIDELTGESIGNVQDVELIYQIGLPVRAKVTLVLDRLDLLKPGTYK